MMLPCDNTYEAPTESGTMDKPTATFFPGKFVFLQQHYCGYLTAEDFWEAKGLRLPEELRNCVFQTN